MIAAALALWGCSQGGDSDANGAADEGNNSADANAIYPTYGVHNPPGDSPCAPPTCIIPRKAGDPPDPIYPEYWQAQWTMYRVYEGYADFPPPYSGPPPEGTTYEASQGASYYDSTWRGPGGDGAMMEHYEKKCLPIFPDTPNDFTCSFISLGKTAYFLTYEQDRPQGMPPVCLFSPYNHPPRRDFVKHLPYSKEDSERLGPGAQAYSFWVTPEKGPIQVGAAPDRTKDQAILFGYAFAPVGGKMQPQSFYFSGWPFDPPNAPIVAQVYRNFQPTKPDPAKTWDQVSRIDPNSIPACTVMDGPSPKAGTLKGTQGREHPSWFDLGRARRKG